tara:strand:+ start:1356 stop:1841 length:486 start_codon:yes stop_codon:yes gene_type:complete
MKGDKKIIDALNAVLGQELVAINQYFLHARMLQDQGVAKLGKLEYEASIDEMKHADELIKRILFLEGLPNLQKLGPLFVGTDTKSILECDLKLEHQNHQAIKDGIKASEDLGDYVSRDLFASILKSEEDHIDWLEMNLTLINNIGIERFIQSQMEPDEASH